MHYKPHCLILGEKSLIYVAKAFKNDKFCVPLTLGMQTWRCLMFGK